MTAPPDDWSAEEHESLRILKPGVAIAGQFSIEKVLGVGGFGAVFLCRGRGEKRYALKTPRRIRLADPETLAAFRAEVRRWMGLDPHPHIVFVYGLVEFLRLPFLIMEFLEMSCSMEDAIERGATDWESALRWGYQIASALDYAQRKHGLLHRDIKPGNVMVSRGQLAKITDFGLSVATSLESDSLSGEPVGTPGYAAPELYRGNVNNVQSDIYSFGALLFEVAVKKLYFGYLSQPQAKGEPPDPRTLQKNIPEAMARFIVRCLSEMPHDRPRDFSALSTELKALHEMLLGCAPPLVEDKTDPRTKVERLIDISTAYTDLGDTEKALRAGRDAVAIDPTHAGALLALGNAFAVAGRYQEAITYFLMAHRSDPRYVLPIVNLALAYSLLRDRENALKWANSALVWAQLGAVEHLESLSVLFSDFGEHSMSLRLCRQILAENPLSVITWNNQAIVLRRMGAYEEAFRSASRAIELNPGYAKAFVNQANALIHLNRPREAVKAAQEATKYDPRLAGAYAAQATALVRLGVVGEARACLERGLEQLPNHPVLTGGLKDLPR